MTQGHRHAQLALEYWTEAHGDEEAWKNWDCKPPHGKTWEPLTTHPAFDEFFDYRRRPPQKAKFIKIGDRLVPEPMRVAPAIGTIFHVAAITRLGVYQAAWDSDEFDFARLRARICHLTREAAQQHMDAMIALNNQEGVEV